MPANVSSTHLVYFRQQSPWIKLQKYDKKGKEYREIVFHRPHSSEFGLPPPLEGIERVQTAKLLGVVFQGSFSFVTHVAV